MRKDENSMPDVPPPDFVGAAAEIWSTVNYAAYHLAYTRVYLRTHALQTSVDELRRDEQAVRQAPKPYSKRGALLYCVSGRSSGTYVSVRSLYSNVVPAVASWLLLNADKERAITTFVVLAHTTHSRLAIALGGYFRGKWIERGSTLI
jgi:hypothetical protein